MELWLQRSGIRDETINGVQLDVGTDRAGAQVTFCGVVRNHDDGRGVTRIEYVGHPSAGELVQEIVRDALERPGVLGAAAIHRVGLLEVGDVAFLAAVSAAHRREAFEACSWLVDEIKKRLPVWKNQHFVDGSTEWSNCP